MATELIYQVAAAAVRMHGQKSLRLEAAIRALPEAVRAEMLGGDGSLREDGTAATADALTAAEDAPKPDAPDLGALLADWSCDPSCLGKLLTALVREIADLRALVTRAAREGGR